MNWKIKYEDIARELRRTSNSEILFHHRLSTSTDDRPTSCHPFSTKDVFETEFVGAHNGMLWNEHELYEKHKERFGIRYVSDNGKDFNDSEAYVYDLASYFSGLIDGIEMEGYGAFILVEYDKATHKKLRLHWGTTDATSAPLRVDHNQDHLDISSEGKGWLAVKDTHYIYEYATGDLTFEPLTHADGKKRSKYSPYYNNYVATPTHNWANDDDWDGYGAYKTPPKNATLSEFDQHMIDEENEAILDILRETFPDREHYGFSMLQDGCCEACDDIEFNTPTHIITKQSHSAEFIAVQRVLEAQT